jgi:hypothetical protein
MSDPVKAEITRLKTRITKLEKRLVMLGEKASRINITDQIKIKLEVRLGAASHMTLSHNSFVVGTFWFYKGFWHTNNKNYEISYDDEGRVMVLWNGKIGV